MVRVSNFGRGKRLLSSTKRPPSLSFNGYRILSQRGEVAGKVKLITHLHLVPRRRMGGAVLHSPPTFMAWTRKLDPRTLKLLIFGSF